MGTTSSDGTMQCTRIVKAGGIVFNTTAWEKRMPKKVDHEVRRRHIAEALHRIIDRDGLDAVSLREVATEAGVSISPSPRAWSTRH